MRASRHRRWGNDGVIDFALGCVSDFLFVQDVVASRALSSPLINFWLFCILGNHLLIIPLPIVFLPNTFTRPPTLNVAALQTPQARQNFATRLAQLRQQGVSGPSPKIFVQLENAVLVMKPVCVPLHMIVKPPLLPGKPANRLNHLKCLRLKAARKRSRQDVRQWKNDWLTRLSRIEAAAVAKDSACVEAQQMARLLRSQGIAKSALHACPQTETQRRADHFRQVLKLSFATALQICWILCRFGRAVYSYEVCASRADRSVCNFRWLRRCMEHDEDFEQSISSFVFVWTMGISPPLAGRSLRLGVLTNLECQRFSGLISPHKVLEKQIQFAIQYSR